MSNDLAPGRTTVTEGPTDLTHTLQGTDMCGIPKAAIWFHSQNNFFLFATCHFVSAMWRLEVYAVNKRALNSVSETLL